MMKAAIRHQYCQPAQLTITEIPIPQLAKDEILIRVKATTVNRSDCGVLTGRPWLIRCFIGLFKPKLPVTGTDFAGVVVAKGGHVEHFDIGDNVYGFFDQGLGSHAEYLAVPVKKAVLKIPGHITYQQAAASLEGAHYAYYFLNRMKFKAGDRVLVNGGTGAIGNAALQFLKYFKVEVTVTCETGFTEKLKSQGADKVIDYKKEDFTKLNQQFDYVFDAVGKSTFSKCSILLKPKGIYISSELGHYWQNLLLALLAPFMPGKKVRFPLPNSIHQSMKFIHEQMVNGNFDPLIDREYPFTEIEKAYQYVQSGQKKGNVVLTFD